MVITFLVVFLLMLIFTFTPSTPRILVSYVYHEQTNTKANLDFFLQYGLRHPNVYAIINVKGPAPGTTIAQQSNIKVIRTPNEGFDYGGHLENFNHIGNGVFTFDYVVLMNDSACGPFVNKNMKWYKPFVEKLKHAELVGIIRNQGWFNMFKISLLPELIRLIKKMGPIKHYKDAYNIEQKIGINYKTDNILKIDNWNKPHTPFEAIFVKENRIQVNNSTNKANLVGAHRLSYIKLDVFEKAKQTVREIN